MSIRNKYHRRQLLSKNGFTLIELVVVISLISLLLFFSMPRFEVMQLNDTSRKASQWIIANIRYLKEHSLRDRKPYIMHIGIDTGRLWITDPSMTEENRQQAAQSAFTLPPDIRILDVEYPELGKLSMGRADIHFTEKGYSDKAMIHIAYDDQKQRSFLIEPFLPEVKIYETYQELSE